MERVGNMRGASYGEKAAVVVASERIAQSVLVDGADMGRPRDLKPNSQSSAWPAADGPGSATSSSSRASPSRIVRIGWSRCSPTPTGDSSELTRIANESAQIQHRPDQPQLQRADRRRCFSSCRQSTRVSLHAQGLKKDRGHRHVGDRVPARRSVLTLIMTRAGQDVPIEGTLHVKPDDGTRGADPVQDAKLRRCRRPRRSSRRRRSVLADNPASNNGGREAINRSVPTQSIRIDKMESEADIEVTYAKPPGIDLWFPASMVELYQGPIKVKVTPVMARATTRAKYSDFRQFNTSIKIVQ